MNHNEYLQTIMLTNFGILSADVAYNKRFRNKMDPIFILFLMYVGVFGYKLDRLMLKDSINL
jgi:hypothetical protein